VLVRAAASRVRSGCTACARRSGSGKRQAQLRAGHGCFEADHGVRADAAEVGTCCEGSVIVGTEALPRKIEGWVTGVDDVVSVGADVHGCAPDLPLQTQISQVAARIEEDPEVAPQRHRQDSRGVVVVQVVRAEG
jgi:hypothetical protein